jgi:hypothetical protein
MGTQKLELIINISIFSSMKFRAAILASIIAILTIQPAFSKYPMGNFAEKKTCAGICHMKKKCSKENSKGNNACSPEGCNPFMPCAIGNFFLDEKPYHQSQPVLILSKKMAIKNDNSLSSYIADCWHPPKSLFS